MEETTWGQDDSFITRRQVVPVDIEGLFICDKNSDIIVHLPYQPVEVGIAGSLNVKVSPVGKIVSDHNHD